MSGSKWINSAGRIATSTQHTPLTRCVCWEVCFYMVYYVDPCKGLRVGGTGHVPCACWDGSVIKPAAFFTSAGFTCGMEPPYSASCLAEDTGGAWVLDSDDGKVRLFKMCVPIYDDATACNSNPSDSILCSTASLPSVSAYASLPACCKIGGSC